MNSEHWTVKYRLFTFNLENFTQTLYVASVTNSWLFYMNNLRGLWLIWLGSSQSGGLTSKRRLVLEASIHWYLISFTRKGCIGAGNNEDICSLFMILWNIYQWDTCLWYLSFQSHHSMFEKKQREAVDIDISYLLLLFPNIDLFCAVHLLFQSHHK